MDFLLFLKNKMHLFRSLRTTRRRVVVAAFWETNPNGLDFEKCRKMAFLCIFAILELLFLLFFSFLTKYCLLQFEGFSVIIYKLDMR